MKYKLGLKIIALFLIIGLNSFGIFGVLKSFAFFDDVEGQESSVSLSILDFSLESEDNFAPEISPDIDSEREIKIVNDGEMVFNYNINIDFIDGANAFCQALDLEVWRDNVLLSSSSLLNFSLNNLYLATSSSDIFNFKVLLNNNDFSYWNKTCEFNFVFEGEQTDGEGFSDIEVISNNVESGTWENTADHLVINKVYYDVDSDHGSEPRNEWIELFNPTQENINIKKWKICNHNKCARINASTTVEAGTYLLISHDKSTWKYWEVPQDVQTISSLGGQFEMDNDADMLILRDDEGNIIDQMNWGIVDKYWHNYNDKLWDPALDDVAEGHMLGRVPSGHDTDTISDWEDLSLPIVEVLIPNGGEVWWVGHNEEIYWQASSTNESADSELTISLYYSRNSGQSWGFIGTTTNSGSYSFRLPLFLEDFTYYVPSNRARIKVVAQGPENFMVQSGDISDEDFCPPIDYDLLTEEEVAALKKLGLYNEASKNSSVSGELLNLSIDLLDEDGEDDLNIDNDSVVSEDLDEESEIIDGDITEDDEMGIEDLENKEEVEFESDEMKTEDDEEKIEGGEKAESEAEFESDEVGIEGGEEIAVEEEGECEESEISVEETEFESDETRYGDEEIIEVEEEDPNDENNMDFENLNLGAAEDNLNKDTEEILDEEIIQEEDVFPEEKEEIFNDSLDDISENSNSITIGVSLEGE